MSSTPIRDRFDWAQITATDLKELDRIGSGGLIEACARNGEYVVTHTRQLTWHQSPVIIYGYGDLRHDLAGHYSGDWVLAAEALTSHAWNKIEYWVSQASRTPRLVQALRRDMRYHRFYLTGRPEWSQTEDGAHRIDDRFAMAGEPRITATLSYIQNLPDSLPIRLEMYDRGHLVAAWPEWITTTSHSPDCVREAPVRAHRHLDLHD